MTVGSMLKPLRLFPVAARLRLRWLGSRQRRGVYGLDSDGHAHPSTRHGHKDGALAIVVLNQTGGVRNRVLNLAESLH